MKKSILFLMFLSILFLFSLGITGCEESNVPQSTSGVSRISVAVSTDQSGYTIEQKNAGRRLIEDNKPGAIKHLYVISAYSGQVIIYSTVKGKVTSGGKRLSPYTVNEGGEMIPGDPIPIEIGGKTKYTTEVLQDDGTYGHSINYLFWWDTKGVYHQHYIEGGQIVHISDQPLSVKGIIINLDLTKSGDDS